jgi:hypothetical protein
MAKDTLKLTDQEVLTMACKQLQTHLPLKAQGYKCQRDDLYHVLVGLAARRSTLE